MNCLKHRKEHVGPCMWCGKQLCPECIARQENKKIYCDQCINKLPPLPQTTTQFENQLRNEHGH